MPVVLRQLEREGIGYAGLYYGWNPSVYGEKYGSIIVPQALIDKEPWRFFGEKPNKEFAPSKYYITDGGIPLNALKRIIVYDVLSDQMPKAQLIKDRNPNIPIQVFPGH